MERALGRPLLALLVVQLAFATFAVAGKFALSTGLDPLGLAAVRVFLAALLFGIWRHRRGAEGVPRRDLAKLAGLSVVGVIANQLLFLEGLARTTAINASILIVLIPVFTFLVALALGKERFRPLRGLGILLGLLGALVLLRIEAFDRAPQLVLGNVLVVLNCLSYSLYLVLGRDTLTRYRTSTVAFWTFAFGALAMAPIGAWPLVDAHQDRVFTSAVLVAIGWIVLVPSFLAYSLNNFALKHLDASLVAGFVFLQPVGATALALWLLPQETIGVREFVAGALIVLGVVLVSRRGRPIRQAAPA